MHESSNIVVVNILNNVKTFEHSDQIIFLVIQLSVGSSKKIPLKFHLKNVHQIPLEQKCSKLLQDKGLQRYLHCVFLDKKMPPDATIREALV